MSYVYRPIQAGWETMPAGSWYSTQDQAPTVIDTPQAMTLNNTDFQRYITLVDSSKLLVSYAGIYNLQFSAQMYNSDGGGSGAHAHIWLSKNGTAVPDTASRVSITPNSPYAVPAWNFFVEAAVNDYFELIFEVNTVGIGLDYTAANTTPGIPSLIVTMNQVG